MDREQVCASVWDQRARHMGVSVSVRRGLDATETQQLVSGGIKGMKPTTEDIYGNKTNKVLEYLDFNRGRQS
jgi:hypothetical protein